MSAGTAPSRSGDGSAAAAPSGSAAVGSGAVPSSTPPALVFDFGGIVLRWRPQAVVRAALPARVAALGDAAAAHWAAQVFQGGGGDWGEFDRGRLEPAELADRIAARTELGRAEVLAVVDAVAAELLPIDDSVALVERLHAHGHRLFFLSNMPAPTAAMLRVRHPVLFACFADGVFSSDVHAVKPEPAIYVEAARRFGVAPGALLFIDDHAPNIAAAHALGWQGFVGTDPAQIAAELHARGYAGALP